jgi:hypothetical protein
MAITSTGRARYAVLTVPSTEALCSTTRKRGLDDGWRQRMGWGRYTKESGRTTNAKGQVLAPTPNLINLSMAIYTPEHGYRARGRGRESDL